MNLNIPKYDTNVFTEKLKKIKFSKKITLFGLKIHILVKNLNFTQNLKVRKNLFFFKNPSKDFRQEKSF